MEPPRNTGGRPKGSGPGRVHDIVLNVRCPHTLALRLTTVAARRRVSRGEAIRRAIEQWIATPLSGKTENMDIQYPSDREEGEVTGKTDNVPPWCQCPVVGIPAGGAYGLRRKRCARDHTHVCSTCGLDSGQTLTRGQQCYACSLENKQLRRLYIRIGGGRSFVDLAMLGTRSGWGVARFHAALADLRQKQVVELHGGDPSGLSPKDREWCYVADGVQYLTLSWRGPGSE